MVKEKKTKIVSEYEQLWTPGNLFHWFHREKTNDKGEIVDRLDEILKRGLVPPALDTEDKVVRNLPKLTVKNTPIPYNSVVFLYSVHPVYPFLYRPSIESDPIYAFIDRNIPFLTPEDLGESWPVITMGKEVYSQKIIPANKFIAVAAATKKVPSIYKQFQNQLAEFDIKLFDFAGRRYL